MAEATLNPGDGIAPAADASTDLRRQCRQLAGLRLGVMEAARLVPLAGQLVAAGIGYRTVNTVAKRHIDQCERLLAELNKEAFRHE
ncbi:hypothetical protein [Dechloromonas sp.]|uniref:hypothetical protein n=1 Tax=Dechloromonas sp. TaxID=1917218 RepID=UPI00121EFEBD|nr:hypothetical protein [Dechloromonas sp.]MBU3696963.1 hypothetical protein [Dechloromonas sp.]TEX49343.1 MAG: hypothetical protein CFR70_03915 [Rhodocyclaceae bacterium]